MRRGGAEQERGYHDDHERECEHGEDSPERPPAIAVSTAIAVVAIAIGVVVVKQREQVAHLQTA